MYGLVALKKQIQSEGGSSLGLVLSQMNRNIKSVERIANKELHRPNTSDLMGASAIEFCADYILFSHIPAKLGIRTYTTSNYPTKYKVGDLEVDIPYFELVKNRSGIPNVTIPMMNGLEFFDLDEMDKEVFIDLVNQFKESQNSITPKINLHLRPNEPYTNTTKIR